MKFNLDESYWTERYHQQHTGWDLGQLSPPIGHYIDQLTDKNLAILIPGSGNSYEAAYLYQQGFHKVHIVDISEAPLKAFKQRHPEFPESQILHNNFFSVKGRYDLIIEQTFLSALSPDLRPQYVDKILKLLMPGGKLVGLLFDDPLFDNHPPFGGSREEYLTLFGPHFKIRTFDTSFNSVRPRQDREFFMILEKPNT